MLLTSRAVAGCALAAFCLLAAAPAFAARPPKDGVYVRSGLTMEQIKADEQVCIVDIHAAGEAMKRPKSGAPGQGPIAAQAGAAFAVGALQGVSEVNYLVGVYEQCQIRLGYTKRVLTPDEAKAYSKLRSDDQKYQFSVEISAKYFPTAPATN